MVSPRRLVVNKALRPFEHGHIPLEPKQNGRAGIVSTVRPHYTPFQVDFGRGCAIVAAPCEATVKIRPMVFGYVAAYDSNCSFGSNCLWGT